MSQTGIYKTQMNDQIITILALENCGYREVCTRRMCRIGPYEVDITVLQNYKYSESNMKMIKINIIINIRKSIAVGQVA